MNQNTLSITDVAWAAGLFEGEGCISIYNNGRPVPIITLHLGMTDQDVVERFVHCIGGEIDNIKCIETGFKPMYRWYTSRRREVNRILNLFLPYFGERRSAKALEALTSPQPTKVMGEGTAASIRRYQRKLSQHG